MQKKVVKIDLTTNQEYIVEDGWTISKYLDVSAHYLIVVLEKLDLPDYRTLAHEPVGYTTTADTYAGEVRMVDGSVGAVPNGFTGNTVMFDPYSTTTIGRTR